MKIDVGNYIVYHSGLIIGNENEPIDFIFNKDDDFRIRIMFISTIDRNPTIKAERFNKNGILLNFFNFGGLGNGNTAPLFLGRFEGKSIFLNYRVYSLDKGGKTFEYTFLLGKEDKNV